MLRTATFLTVLALALSVLALRLDKLSYGNTRFGIDLAQRTFIKDGAPFRYISGEVHYFRIHPTLWEDRLQRIRHLGLNAIQVYVPWNYHEQLPGAIDFKSEDRDLANFLKLAHQNELYVLLRIGPYVCAEWENGGLPWWLLKTPNIGLRKSDNTYFKAVKSFFDVLLPIVKQELYIGKNRGPVLMIQVENEYGSYSACDKSYMAWLRDLVHDALGDDVTLYTTDGPNQSMLNCGTINGVFPTVDFGTEAAGAVSSHFDLQQSFSRGGPKVNSEYYVTWFSSWGDKSLPRPETEAVIRSAREMYALNASFNVFLAHGGTNFGFWNGAEYTGPILTTYDYVAPISEAGDITPAYLTLHNWIKGLPKWSNPPLDVPQNLSALTIESIETTKVTDLLTVVKNLIVNRECQTSELPLPFEAFSRPYTFVLYTTVLSAKNVQSNNNYSSFVISASAVNNIGYVYLENEFQGIVSSVCGIKNHSEWCRPTLTLRLQNGSTSLAGKSLEILVENVGRITYETIRDSKGLHEVKLNSTPLTHWTQCGVGFELLTPDFLQKLKTSSSSKINEVEKNGGVDDLRPAVYVGHFDGKDVKDWRLFNTYFDSRPFVKGFTLVNGFNIGRYWPILGPQMTLYAPGPIFQSSDNTVIVVELLGRNGYRKMIQDHNNCKRSNPSDSKSGRSESVDSGCNNKRYDAMEAYWCKSPTIRFIDHPVYQ